MDSRHRDIIEEYRNLITRNLIVSEDFYRVLVTHGVFSEGSIKDIKKAPRGEAQSQLLDLLLTRTNQGFGKFCDVLEVTGHRFLSDCLREAENVEKTNELDIEEFVKKLPFISKAIKNDQQKLAVQRYFKDKIHNEVVKQTWRGDISTKEKLMVTRQQQIEQMWQHEEESLIKDKGMVDLQKDYLSMQTRADDLRREIKSLHKHIEDMARKHQEALSTQIKFNMANDRHLNRLNDRAEDADSYLLDIRQEVKAILGDDYYERQARTEYENLSENFIKLMKRHKELCSLSKKFRDERSYISTQLRGEGIADDDSIKPHLQQYIIKNEDALTDLHKRIEGLKLAAEEQREKMEKLGHVQKRLDEESHYTDATFNQNFTMLQQQIEASKQKLKARDDRIEVLETDINSLMGKIKDLEKRLAESKENEKKARRLADVTIVKTPSSKPAPLPANASARTPVGQYPKKPTATRSTGVFLMASTDDGASSLDAIKGCGFNSTDTLPPGVKSQGNVQAAVKNAGAVNGSTGRAPKLAVNRSTRRM
ncbi:uncharacterized protein [Watersipora subatra]|uniref:uncharacterized protein n=1 Tax=Watersipora subatra TaxID=2589382 RepID=UPI00355B5608